MLITVGGSAEAFAMPWSSRFWIVRKKMPIIRDVRERVLTKLHELQPQASGNKVLGMKAGFPQHRHQCPSTVAMVTGIEVDALGSRVWWTNFGKAMAVLYVVYARRRGCDRNIYPFPEAVQPLVPKWPSGIDDGETIRITTH